MAAPAAYGIAQLMKSRDPLDLKALAWLAGSLGVGWLAVNWLGLFGNRAMRTQLLRRSLEAGESLADERIFVGIASPTFKSALDAHQDVGFLFLEPSKLRFAGDHESIEIEKKSILNVGLQRNIHSWLGLGGWVTIDGILDGKRIRLNIEPRERDTLLGNRGLRKPLRDRLNKWIAAELSAEKTRPATSQKGAPS